MARSQKRGPSVTIYMDEERHMEFKMIALKSRRAMADIGRELLELYTVAYNQDPTVDAETVIARMFRQDGSSEKLKEIQRLINEILAVEK